MARKGVAPRMCGVSSKGGRIRGCQSRRERGGFNPNYPDCFFVFLFTKEINKFALEY